MLLFVNKSQIFRIVNTYMHITGPRPLQFYTISCESWDKDSNNHSKDVHVKCKM